MGTYQDTELHLVIPNVEVAANRIESFMGGGTARGYGWTRLRHDDELAQDYVLDMLVISIGEESSLGIVDDKYPRIEVDGNTYGKMSALQDDVLAILAKAGATGTIDWDCEGHRGRDRLADGAVATYDGVITYPDDPYKD